MITELISRAMAVLLAFTVTTSISCVHDSARRVEVFHKNKEPSLRTLDRTKTVLREHGDGCEIAYYLIDDPDNRGLIRKYNLPGTHFPFAVVIDGKYSASIDGRTVHFLEFPLFMKGIGRHEGDWSLEDLDRVMVDPSLLLDQNVLPESFGHDHADEPCLGEVE